MAIPGCGDGCNNGGGKHPFVGQACQAAKPGNPGAGGQYLCPEGYFCKYANEKDIVNPHVTGECESMDKLCRVGLSPELDRVSGQAATGA